MIGLCAPFHESCDNLPQRDVHILFDEYDAVEVVSHQLASNELDFPSAFIARA
jgi:hypothetical protein